MMARRRLLALVVLLAPALLGTAPSPGSLQGPAPAGFEEVAVAELLADPGAYSGAGVVVRGELVGDFGRRGDGSVWAQLNDDPYADAPLLDGGSLAGPNTAIGVHVPAGEWPGLHDPGGYRVRGPLVELRGVWRFHDPARGGESYLDVEGLELIEPARPLEEGVRWVPLGLGAGLVAAALAVGLVGRRRGSSGGSRG